MIVLCKDETLTSYGEFMSPQLSTLLRVEEVTPYDSCALKFVFLGNLYLA